MFYVVMTVVGLLTLGWCVRLLKKAGQSGRVGTDPHCVACGQNVRGVESDRCPECGATLDDNGLATGRPALHAVQLPGIIVLFFAGLGVLGLGVQGIVQTDWRAELVPWLPDSNLASMAHGTGTWRQAATLELERRFVEDDLSDKERLELGTKLYPLNMATRRSVPIGESLAVDITVPTTSFSNGLGGFNSASKYKLDYRLRATQFDELPADQRDSRGGNSRGIVSYSSSYGFKVPDDLPPGTHKLRLRWTARLLPKSADELDPDAVGLAEREIEQVLPFDVLPEGETDVALVADPSLAAQIDAAIKVAVNAALPTWQQTHVELRRDRQNPYGAQISWSIQHAQLPVPIAATVHLRDSNGHEWAAAELTCNSGSLRCAHSYGTGERIDLQRFPGGPVDLILRPDPLVAAGTHDIHRIWANTIVIPGVPVTMPKAMNE